MQSLVTVHGYNLCLPHFPRLTVPLKNMLAFSHILATLRGSKVLLTGAFFPCAKNAKKQMSHQAILKNKSSVFHPAFFLLLGAAVPFFVSGCGRFDLEPSPVVLVIGDQRLTADVLKKDMAFVSEDLPLSVQDTKQIKTRLLDHIIDRYLMMEYARKHGISIDDDEFQTHLNEIKEGYTETEFEQAMLRKFADPEAWAKRLREQLLMEKVIETVTEDMAPPSYEEMKAYFESNPNQFKTPDMVKFRQIFCRTQKEAKQLHKRIRKGETLAELAREHSAAPEAENGGEVGWVARGSLDEALEKRLFSLAPGEIGPVTKGPSGYHIFEVISRRPAGFQAFSEVIRVIELKITHQSRAHFCREWLRNLRADFTVKINQEAINKLEFS